MLDEETAWPNSLAVRTAQGAVLIDPCSFCIFLYPLRIYSIDISRFSPNLDGRGFDGTFYESFRHPAAV